LFAGETFRTRELNGSGSCGRGEVQNIYKHELRVFVLSAFIRFHPSQVFLGLVCMHLAST
jgi:hypothetical protein